MAARVVSAVLALVLLTAAAAPASPEATPIAVIVHPARASQVSADELAQIFLRRKRFWEDGTAVVPLNLPAGTPLRARFTRAVLRDSETRLSEYWNRQYFYGVLPPSTLASTEGVRRYVASDPNAIGYVPAAEVDASVRVVLRLE